MGPKADAQRIPGIDVALADGETWAFGGLEMHVFDTPGHTRGHITLWFPEADALFPGEHLPVLRVLSITSCHRACLQPLQGGLDLQVQRDGVKRIPFFPIERPETPAAS